MRTDLGRGHTYLRPPVVVTAAAVPLARPIQIDLQAIRRSRRHQARKTIYRLRPPVVVTAAPTQIFFGPSVTYWAAVKSRQTSKGQRRDAKYSLRPPAVVGAGISWHGPGVYLTRPSQPAPVHSRLQQFIPEVAVVAEVSYGPSVTLTRIRPPRVYPDLGAPIVLDVGGALGWIGIQLAPSRRPVAKSRLPQFIPEAVVAQAYYGPEVTLARSRRGTPRSFLRPPVIPPVARPTEVTLAPQRRGAPRSLLQPPTVVFLAVEIYGPEVHLTRITPPPVRSVLQPPAVVTQVVVETFYGPDVHLAPSSRPVAKFVLHPPTDTIGLEDQGRVQIALAPQSRGLAKSLLSAPRVVFEAVEIYGPEVHLTRIKPAPVTYFLLPFSARAFEVSYGPQVTLTPSRRPVTKSRLEPPTVVAPVVSYGPVLWLTYSRRGSPKSILRAPRVLAQAPAYRQVLPPTFAPQRRGRPTYFLSPPTRVFPFRARPTAVSLAPQSRGRPTYFLNPPRVVRLAVEIYGPETWLTYSRRGRPQYRLEPPAVVGKAPFRAIKTWLTSIKPRPTVALLRTPVVVRVPVAGQLQVHLTYSRRGRPISFRLPEVQGKAPFRGIQVYLTRIKPPPVLSLLKPPTLVGAGIAFFGPSVTLVRITPPPVTYFLKITLVAFRRPGGDVCGFDIATTFVCFLELPGSQVSGTDAPRAQVSGSSRAGSTMTGSDNAGSSVSGSDRKAT
jgi:hypothetical protein